MTQKEPLVSIIISVYNSAATLSEALESLLVQSYPHFECVCIDDGSSDTSVDILKDYAAKDARIHVHAYTENKGLAVRLNEAFAVAKGAYIARMDADDIAYPKRLEKQVAYLEAHPQVDICGTAFRQIPNGKICKMPLNHRDILTHMFLSPGLAHPTVMFRAASWHAQGWHYPELSCAQDYGLWVRLYNTATFANLPEVLLDYRRHVGSITARKTVEKKQVLEGIHKQVAQRLWPKEGCEEVKLAFVRVAPPLSQGKTLEKEAIRDVFTVFKNLPTWALKKKFLSAVFKCFCRSFLRKKAV